MCYGRSTYGDLERPRPDPPRAPDHGHPLSPRPGHCCRSDDRPVWRTELFNRPDPASGARRQRASDSSGRGTALRLQPGCAAPNGPQIGASASRRHVFRRIRRTGGRRDPRRRRRPPLRRRARADCRDGGHRRDGGQSEKGEEAMNPVAEIVLKVSLILLAALLIAMALRTRSAALRHWGLSVGIVCAFTTPLLMPIAPAWRLPFRLSSDGPTRAEPRAIPVESAASVPRSIDQPPANNGVAAGSSRLSASQWLTAIWIAGTGIGLMALLVGLARLSWIRSRARRVDDQKWLSLAEDVGRSLSIRRRVTLLQSDHPSLLFTSGHFRPVVVLPRAAAEWSAERARIVLCHELAHVRRADWLTLLAAGLLRAAYWFNPLAWAVGRRLRDESERACDDEVMSQGIEGTDYATELLALARILNAGRPTWVAAPAMARRSSLERRVTAMVNTHINRQPVGRAPRVAIMAMTFALAVAVGGFSAAQTFASFSGSVLDQTGNIVTGVALSM